MINYCTLFDKNYVKQGSALYGSMEEHCKPYHLWILALDDTTWEYLSHAALPNVTVVRMDAFETAKIALAKSDRSWKEYIWTLASSWMRWCLRRQNLESVSYIDADCFFFASPGAVFKEIGTAAVAITPHRFAKKHQGFEVNGLYNVGLVYANQRGLYCVDRWAELCLEWCKGTAEDGRFADQKYWDSLVPKYHVHVIEHLGANLAPWNQGQYDYSTATIGKHGGIFISEPEAEWSYPLIWYHFHQGLKPQWALHPGVQELIYPVYSKALEDAPCYLSSRHLSLS